MVADEAARVDEFPLPAGRMTEGVVRRGGQVLRPMGPWSPGELRWLQEAKADPERVL